MRIASEDASFGFPERPRGIPPSYAAARMALPAAVATELTLTGRTLDAAAALRPRDRQRGPPGRRADAAGAGAGREDRRRSALGASTETKRRILAERESNFGHLFDAEEEALRAALLEDDEPDGAA